MDTPLFCSITVLILLLLQMGNTSVDGQLSPTFYERSCPNLEALVSSAMKEIVSKEPGMAASILRLFFHDCFVMGCDASVLLADTPTFTGEQNAGPNRGTIRGMDSIALIKANVEAACSGMVSCADILALAARDGVVLVGGPSWTVMLGRRDATTASRSAAEINIPSPRFDVDTLTSNFAGKGLSQRDLVALSGAHTIGVAHIRGGGLLPLDVQTSGRFDNAFYQNLAAGKGFFPSDQVLFQNNSTKPIVESYLRNQSAFFVDFAAAMVRLGAIGTLTGVNGEVRKQCSKLN